MRQILGNKDVYGKGGEGCCKDKGMLGDENHSHFKTKTKRPFKGRAMHTGSSSNGPEEGPEKIMTFGTHCLPDQFHVLRKGSESTR